MVVVGAPSLIGERKINTPEQLVEMPWLQELGTNEVADWMSRHGVKLKRPLMITHMPGNLIMEALRRGDGITYTARPWVDTEIGAGGLMELFSDRAFGNYYIQTRPGRLSASIEIFVQWLKQQSASQTTASRA